MKIPPKSGHTESVTTLVFYIHTFFSRLSQISFGTTYQNWENLPNYHKIYQMAAKYTSNGRKTDAKAIK
jgi:hypothetical protein